jgi:hypothetical protein
LGGGDGEDRHPLRARDAETDVGLPLSETARRMGIARSTLREMVLRVERSGLPWPLPLDLSDADLEARLYGEAGTKQGHRHRAEPDWPGGRTARLSVSPVRSAGC